MDFVKELKWRGMWHNATPGVEKHLASGRRTGYIGFDPTAPSLTLGNMVQVMILKLFQMSGHQPLVLMGGATGRIGDPSGKDKERDLKPIEELDKNLQAQVKQIKKFLDFETADNGALMVNNLDFYKDMNVLDFLREVGKTLTVSYMLKKDSVQNRIEKGISFTEFSYQLIQGYDFQILYNEYGCTLQMGGSDQWGNITSGTEFIRKNLEQSAFAITTPLLTKSDGTKFGKSTEGNIWLDPQLTSPYKFYQFWINADDADIAKFTRYFTLKSQEEIEQREQDLATDPKEQKRLLAEELTIRIHSQEDFDSVAKVSDILFNRKAKRESLFQLSDKALYTVAGEIPAFKLPRSTFEGGVNIVELMAVHTGIVPSKGAARRAIKDNAVSVNKEKVTDHDQRIALQSLMHDKFLMIENGKKNKFMIIAE